MNHLPLIIKREYLTKVKNKSFIIMTFLSPIIFITLIAVVAYLSQVNSDKVRVISVLDESGLIENTLKKSENTSYNVLPEMTLEDAKELVKESEGYGLLHIRNFSERKPSSKDFTFYSEESPSITLISDIEYEIQSELTLRNRANKGIDVETLKSTKVNIDITQESFAGEKTSKVDSIVKLIFGCAAGYLLFMFIIIYGNMIMRSVIEEKTSRIIEVIISSVKPVQLMLGKIIGTSLAGITQLVIWIILGGFLMLIVSLVIGINLFETQTPQQEIMQQSLNGFNFDIESLKIAFWSLPLVNLIIAFILFFISGYLLYSSLYAAIGAAVDNETDTQQFMLPIIMPLILAVYIGIFTVIEDPHGTVSTVFSFIPLTSPVVMLMRIPFGVPLWQQALSLLILVGSFMFTVWFAAKIYRVGILMYGKKPSYKELMKWIRY
ncbi:ABC transporter permease [uncultured Algibacter sp.]|uniref:ABC transporter permease n=1 Tax=uncultured Algibacter sp. TaxID=298659 RepID=UPI00263698C7|nr:ABC transporter permease [uncultured Algibacter sp.]